MKRNNLFLLLFVLILFVPFFISDDIYNLYETLNKNHGFILSFIKFSILATLGEVIGLRIKTGHYNASGFGIIPRAIVWGFLGITIKLAFIVFTSGTLDFLTYMGMENPASVYKADFTMQKLFIAFCISFLMNSIFAPVMMTIHKVTDTHILNTGGTIIGFFKPIKVSHILTNLNWDVQWNFVFKKTIPFFWYPAHTITFLLPAEFQILFAALLGIALGLILAISSLKGR